MENKLIKVLVFLLAFTAPSCHQNKIPEETQSIIDNSGNRFQLEKVVNHYSKQPTDSIKLKAAYFLINNMDGWYYYSGKQLDEYQQYDKLIRRDPNHGEYFMHSFNRLYDPFSFHNLIKKNDLQSVSAEELITNIDMAFKVWERQPWGKSIDFNDFCEYILPYRIKDEIPEYNRGEIYEKFNPLLDSIRNVKGTVVEAGRIINDALNTPRWIFTERTSFLPHFQASQIIKYRTGSCREMTSLAFYVMRATGIPVAIDFVQQWPYRDSGHEFNVLLDSNKKMIAFLGAEDSPGTPHKPLTKKGKVFRHIFENNPESLANFIRSGDEVPDFLNDKKIRDVTDEYARVHSVNILLDSNSTVHLPKQRLVYLSVFNNTNWVPIDGVTIKDHEAHFKKIEGGIVYMAGYFHQLKIIPAGYPFILDDFGNIHYLKPDHQKMYPLMLLSRLFPITADNYNTWAIKGCHFQGAKRADFSDARDLYVIPNKPNPFWNTVGVKLKESFRYVRFWSPANTNMGEIEFYSKGRKLIGEPIGTNTGWYREKSFVRAFDGDTFTEFNSSGSTTPTWAGLDLHSTHSIDSIRYSPPLSEDSTARILPNHNYELFYWESGNWVSAGSKNSKGQTITFSLIPENALYLLKDKTQQVKERIFTYQNGKQIWW